MPPRKPIKPHDMVVLDKLSVDHFKSRTQLGRRDPKPSAQDRKKRAKLWRWNDWPVDRVTHCSCGVSYKHGDCYRSGHYLVCTTLTEEDKAYYARVEENERRGLPYEPLTIPDYNSRQLCMERPPPDWATYY